MKRDRRSPGVENPSARILAFVTAVAILSPKPTLAGQNVWTSQGPDKSVTAVASNPSDPRTVYAATKNSGVYKTTDGGETWTRLDSENSSLDEVTCLAMGPRTTTIFGGNAKGEFLRSVDGGAHWEAKLPDRRPFPGPVGALTVDSATGAIFLGTHLLGEVASTASDPILKSTDGGNTWSRTGLAAPREIYALLADSVSQTLYAGTDLAYSGDYYLFGAGGAAARSSNGGVGWDISPVYDSRKPVTALASESGARTVYAGTASGLLYRSFDRGASWQYAASFGGSFSALAVDPRRPATVYAATFGGVFQSADSGATWHLFGSGLGYRPTSLTIDATGTVLHAGTLVGVFDIVYDPLASPAECADRLPLLSSRFRAELVSANPVTSEAFCAHAVPMTDRFGYFSFPALTGDATLPEVFIKMVDATALPGGGYWVFYSSLTHLPYSLRVTDAVTGERKEYRGEGFTGGADTSGFPASP
jgi:photosystem II stability/assembly factor-like uncharacterized protein